MPPATCCGYLRTSAAAAVLGASLVGLGQLPRTTAQDTAAGESLTFGGSRYRNMVNLSAKGLPTEWHVENKKYKNIKWVADLGTRSYGGIAVGGGKIFVGTNNDRPRDPKVKGPRGVIMCFDAKGTFLWQVAHDMPEAQIVREALRDGQCGTPTLDGDRMYYVTPAAKLVCGSTKDGSTIWQIDMMKDLKVVPNYVANCSPLVVGDTVYVLTGNGTDEQGKVVAPEAPSFLAVSKKDGAVKWKSSLPGTNIFEGQWSNPTWAEVNGKGQVIFPGGDAYLYALDPATGQLLWKFHCNPKKEEAELKKRGLPNYIVSTPVFHEGKIYIGVGLYPEHPVGNKVGHFWCIDVARATQLGAKNKDRDVSPKGDNFDPKAPENKDSALAWHFGGEMEPRPKFGRSVYFGRTISTAAVHDGLVYIAEEMGYLHCLDAATGKQHWVHDFKTGIWGSPYWADGKVYIGTEDGDVFIFAHGKQKRELGSVYMEEAVPSTPVASGSTLYVATKSKLYAIEEKR